jgi:hypothetical protein
MILWEDRYRTQVVSHGTLGRRWQFLSIVQVAERWRLHLYLYSNRKLLSVSGPGIDGIETKSLLFFGFAFQIKRYHF